MATKAYNFPLRFRDKKQRNEFKAIAKKNGRSINSELIQIIDNRISQFRILGKTFNFVDAVGND